MPRKRTCGLVQAAFPELKAFALLAVYAKGLGTSESWSKYSWVDRNYVWAEQHGHLGDCHVLRYNRRPRRAGVTAIARIGLTSGRKRHVGCAARITPKAAAKMPKENAYRASLFWGRINAVLYLSVVKGANRYEGVLLLPVLLRRLSRDAAPRRGRRRSGAPGRRRWLAADRVRESVIKTITWPTCGSSSWRGGRASTRRSIASATA